MSTFQVVDLTDKAVVAAPFDSHDDALAWIEYERRCTAIYATPLTHVLIVEEISA